MSNKWMNDCTTVGMGVWSWGGTFYTIDSVSESTHFFFFYFPSLHRILPQTDHILATEEILTDSKEFIYSLHFSDHNRTK